MPTPRVSRGRKSQELLAAWFRDHGWEGAESRPASLPGTDVTGMPGWAPEVKATEKELFTTAVKQAVKNASGGEWPFVVFRPRGYGPEKIGQWLVVLDVDTFTDIMRVVDGFEPQWKVFDA